MIWASTRPGSPLNSEPVLHSPAVREALSRRPLGTPLHLSAAHFALALGAAGIVLDLVAWLGLGTANTTAVNVGAYALVLFVVVVAVLAALAAVASTLDLDADSRQTGWSYAGLLALATLIAVVNAVLRSGSLRDQVVPPAPLFLSLVMLVLLAIATFLGGQLAMRELEEEFEEELEEPEPIRRRRRR